MAPKNCSKASLHTQKKSFSTAKIQANWNTYNSNKIRIMWNTVAIIAWNCNIRPTETHQNKIGNKKLQNPKLSINYSKYKISNMQLQLKTTKTKKQQTTWKLLLATIIGNLFNSFLFGINDGEVPCNAIQYWGEKYNIHRKKIY